MVIPASAEQNSGAGPVEPSVKIASRLMYEHCETIFKDVSASAAVLRYVLAMIDKIATTAYADILETVRRIPRGRVATYGQVAGLAGFPRGARLVGMVLQRLPSGARVPWHRVINAQGRLSFPRGSAHYRLQRSKLEREGVRFKGERVELEYYQWRESAMDTLLWKPR